MPDAVMHATVQALRLLIILVIAPFGIAWWLLLDSRIGAGVWFGVAAVVVLATFVIDPGKPRERPAS